MSKLGPSRERGTQMGFKISRGEESLLIAFPDDAIFLTEKEIFDEVFLIIIFSFNNRISFRRENYG